MARSFEKLKELDLSRDEVDRIGEALKQPEFRKLLINYVEELQDPKNKQLYQEEITLLEKERGIDVTFIDPKPGYVVKTSINGNQKAFINICCNENITKPSSSPSFQDGTKGLSWSLPYSLSSPRDDVDNKGIRCQVFDVVFHPDTLHLASNNKTFRTMVNDTALEAVESNFDVKLDKKNLKFPKLNFKGMAHASVIRKPSGNKPSHTPEEKELFDKIFSKAEAQHGSPIKKKKQRNNSMDDNSNYTTPKYVIKHRSHIDIQEFTENRDAKLNAAIPKELILEINLPLLKSSGDLMLDVTEKTVQLLSEKPAKYKLNLTLPYSVNESSGTAKFDKDLKVLFITLPVKRNVTTLTCSDCNDSGIESEYGSPGICETEKDSSENCLVSEVISEKTSTENSTQFRTSFLEKDVDYSLPDFSCHVFENKIAFTLNVKNVNENSVEKVFKDAGSSIHVKFTSISSSFYPSHYAFYVKISSQINVEDTTIEVWDNNVIVQISAATDKSITSYFFGVDETDVEEKYVEEPQVVNANLQENVKNDDFQIRGVKDTVEIKDFKKTTDNCQDMADDQHVSEAIDIMGTSYESSGDELSCNSFSPRKSKGILKFKVGRSISESSLDDYIYPSSFENCHASLDSVIPESPEDQEEMSTSLKKTVRFNDVVMRQLFRSNSSILGQKKKNQRKAQKKKRALERRYSESEASEGDDKKEDEVQFWKKESENKEMKKEDNDIFHIDIDS